MSEGSHRMVTDDEQASAASPLTEPNQCIFLNYYKMKRRFGLFPKKLMQAAGGPHQLPPGPDNPPPGVSPALGMSKTGNIQKDDYVS